MGCWAHILDARRVAEIVLAGLSYIDRYSRSSVVFTFFSLLLVISFVSTACTLLARRPHFTAYAEPTTLFVRNHSLVSDSACHRTIRPSPTHPSCPGFEVFIGQTMLRIALIFLTTCVLSRSIFLNSMIYRAWFM